MSIITLHPENAPAVAPSPARPSGELRLTRRGRVVLVVLALVVTLGIGIVFGAVSVASEEGGVDVPTQTVVVTSGDTLWDIAGAVADDGEIPEMMAEIERINALDSKVLQLGQRLRVPLAGD